ncbi:MAG: (2Fe-2S)-binding protein [Actinomycetales bacterium]|nr:(2Fe-2S)-binding protein [Actinomycetales bacterium]
MRATLVHRITVNGVLREVSVPPSTTLLAALREQCGLTGTKFNCEQGECGACTVLMDELPVNTCLVLAASADGHDVVTVEGIDGPGPSVVQQAIMATDASQCGYCTPGMVVSATALIARCPKPTREDVDEAISGNYCRCTGYESIITAIEQAAQARSE